jgi:hypothetical protein
MIKLISIIDKDGNPIEIETVEICNRIFNRRPFTLNNNDTIMIQSKLEQKFVEWCDSIKSPITNGPTVPYIHNGKEHKYHIDFLLPSLKLLIEVKDNHVWHLKQIETGKWDSKENAAKKLIDGHTYIDYLIITPKNWDQMISIIISEDIV